METLRDKDPDNQAFVLTAEEAVEVMAIVSSTSYIEEVEVDVSLRSKGSTRAVLVFWMPGIVTKKLCEKGYLVNITDNCSDSSCFVSKDPDKFL